jgi:hypothetical protein
MNRDDRVLAIVLAAEHLLRLAGIDLHGELVEGAVQVVGDGLPRLCPFDEDVQIVESLAERDAQLAILLEPAAALQQLLRAGLILPEIGSGDALLYAGELGFGAGRVKDGSAGRARGARGPRTCEAGRPVAMPTMYSSIGPPAPRAATRPASTRSL